MLNYQRVSLVSSSDSVQPWHNRGSLCFCSPLLGDAYIIHRLQSPVTDQYLGIAAEKRALEVIPLGLDTPRPYPDNVHVHLERPGSASNRTAPRSRLGP